MALNVEAPNNKLSELCQRRNFVLEGWATVSMNRQPSLKVRCTIVTNSSTLVNLVR